MSPELITIYFNDYTETVQAKVFKGSPLFAALIEADIKDKAIYYKNEEICESFILEEDLHLIVREKIEMEMDF